MPNKIISPDFERRLQRVSENAAILGFPNPERIGCPADKRILKALAAKKVEPTDQIVDHVAECSPCFREVAEFRRQTARSSWRLLAAAAAVIVLAVSFFYFRIQTARSATAPPVQLAAVLDLRPELLTQRAASDLAPSARSPLPLGRGEVTLSIQLPAEVSGQTFEFKLLKASSQPIQHGSILALNRRGVTAVSLRLETATLSPGTYSLQLRSDADAKWQSFAIKIY